MIPNPKFLIDSTLEKEKEKEKEKQSKDVTIVVEEQSHVSKVNIENNYNWLLLLLQHTQDFLFFTSLSYLPFSRSRLN